MKLIVILKMEATRLMESFNETLYGLSTHSMKFYSFPLSKDTEGVGKWEREAEIGRK